MGDTENTEEISIFHSLKNSSENNHTSWWLGDNSILKTKLNVIFPLKLFW